MHLAMLGSKGGPTSQQRGSSLARYLSEPFVVHFTNPVYESCGAKRYTAGWTSSSHGIAASGATILRF